MSFEGYKQILCINGHYDQCDVYEYFEPKQWRCKHCGAIVRWVNTVDLTNGSYGEDPNTGESIRIDGYVELKVRQAAPTCDKCRHTTGPVVYHIPTDEGHLLDIKVEEKEEYGEFEGDKS